MVLSGRVGNWSASPTRITRMSGTRGSSNNRFARVRLRSVPMAQSIMAKSGRKSVMRAAHVYSLSARRSFGMQSFHLILEATRKGIVFGNDQYIWRLPGYDLVVFAIVARDQAMGSGVTGLHRKFRQFVTTVCFRSVNYALQAVIVDLSTSRVVLPAKLNCIGRSVDHV